MKAKVVQTRKLRFLSTSRLMKGWGEARVCTAAHQKPSNASPASTQTSVELNQSFCSPRSSRSCKAATPRLSEAKPMKSSFLGSASRRSVKNSPSPASASTPTGRLM